MHFFLRSTFPISFHPQPDTRNVSTFNGWSISLVDRDTTPWRMCERAQLSQIAKYLLFADISFSFNKKPTTSFLYTPLLYRISWFGVYEETFHLSACIEDYCLQHKFYNYHLFSGISIYDIDSMAIWFKVSQDLMDSFYKLPTNCLFSGKSICIIHLWKSKHLWDNLV